MEQNSMWFLPQTFRQLEGLEVLALNANNFEMMPRVLCDMDRLVDVRMKFHQHTNRFVQPSLPLTLLRNSRGQLRLGRNGITSLMRGETIQTHLDNGQVITMVVETFKLMTDLKKLTVAMNELTELPPDVRILLRPLRMSLLQRAPSIRIFFSRSQPVTEQWSILVAFILAHIFHNAGLGCETGSS